MRDNIQILCAARDWHTMNTLRLELEKEESFAVQIVNHGMAALECAARNMPDILVIDAVLPGMDGLGVVDMLQKMPGGQQVRVIAGSMMEMADQGFRKRGAFRVLRIPWDAEELISSTRACMEGLDRIDWQRVQRLQEQACLMMEEMGMHPQLKGGQYLAWCAAIAACEGERHPIEKKAIYAAVASRFYATEKGVERLIRHAVESAMNKHAGGMYAFFGNTIDPMRGKPTNAQVISALAEQLRLL